MWYALQDEPEKGHRLAIFAVGVLIAGALQGGGLVAAANYEPPAGLKKAKSSVVEFVTPPPPPVKEEPPPPEPPKVEPPPPEPPPEPPKVEPPPEPPKPKPKPKPEPKPKPKPKPKPEPKPEPPQAPSDKPPPEKPAPVKIGMMASSTDPNATGPKVNVGNTQMGEISNEGSAPVTGRPMPGNKVVEGTPEAPPEPPPPPVKTRAECKLPVTSSEDYPRAARRAGVTGVVVVLATIGADGTVKSAKPVKTLGFGLDEKAIEIVQSATCKAATVDKAPVLAVIRLSVRFELRD